MSISLQEIKNYHQSISTEIRERELEQEAEANAKQVKVRSILRIVQFDTVEGNIVSELDGKNFYKS